MEQTFLTELRINKVRHLKDITIPLSKTERKNLILTGKNGSGKTSVLNELTEHIASVTSGTMKHIKQYLDMANKFEATARATTDNEQKSSLLERASGYRGVASDFGRVAKLACDAEWTSDEDAISKYKNGLFVTAYYGDNRKMGLTPYKNIEKVTLKKTYGITERPSAELGKYLASLRATQAFAPVKGEHGRAVQIENWFERFEDILRRIYGEPSLKLDFDIDTFQFSILIEGREPFDFNTMSMGYAAVFDIVSDLIMRMESHRGYDLEGIVLIDEIETHLHVELQKQIVPILTELFPNIQFILTTHSPFILNSAPNAVIYDLEKHLLVAEGMENLSYEGIVEGYFEVDQYSKELRDAFEEYKELVMSDNRTDAQCARLAALRDYLDEVPDYLAREIAYEYALLKLEHDD